MAIITLFDSEMKEIGPAYINADVETGDGECLNNIEITSELPSDCYGLAILGTDAGGIVEYTNAISKQTPTQKAWTWRGLLTQWIIVPPSGSDYKVIRNMDLNRAIENVLNGVLGGFFTVPSAAAGKTISEFQFDLYTTVLDGLSAMCKSVGYKLFIHAEKNATSKRIEVIVEAKPITYMVGEYDEDSVLKLEFIQNSMGINHMICMGSGELQQRLRVDLYLHPDGSIKKTKHYTGFLERQYYYNDSGAGDLATLEEDGRKYFPEIASGNSLIIHSEPENLEVGDVVKGKYSAKNVSIEAAVIKKIYRITGDHVSIEYATE